MNLKELKLNYELKKQRIQERLKEFQEVMNKDDSRIFEELCFCILTANTSARMGINTVEQIKHLLLTASKEELSQALKQARYRFPNKRAEYITEVKNFLKQDLNFKLKEKLLSFKDQDERRDYLVANIKGIGYKEASHFLRNIGFSKSCILDKHILNSLSELRVLETNSRPKNGNHYLEIEQKMKNFAKDISIDIDELDLLLWSMKTGEILK
jgi:N-glycosylase/DNA lyase